jgi:predicted nuclease of restriction endonuclease-like RecB superfamily
MSGIKGINLGNTHGFKKGCQSLMDGKTKEAGLYPKKCGFQVGHKKYTSAGDFKKDEGLGRANNIFKTNIKYTNSNKSYYKNIYMRSGWEVKYAKWLDSKNIKWEYEKDTFKLKDTTYTPDFYLNEQNMYVEIKGFMHADSYFKIKEFIENNPDIKYLLMTRKDLEKEGII